MLDNSKEKEEEFLSLITEITSCKKCELSLNRTQVVPYRGDPRTDFMIVAEAPGYEEDKQGLAMVGRAGQYFVDLLNRNGFPIENIFITNCVLCRPPNNADPSQKYLTECIQWLNNLIDLINPKVILAVGRFAGKQLLSEIFSIESSITKIEGNVYQSMNYGKIIIPVRHPSAILRQPSLKERYENIISEICNKVREIIE